MSADDRWSDENLALWADGEPEPDDEEPEPLLEPGQHLVHYRGQIHLAEDITITADYATAI